MKEVLLFAGILLALGACQSNTDGYVIKGTVRHAGDGIAVLNKTSGSQDTVEYDTVQMEEGAFVFTGKLDHPEVVVIRLIPEGEFPAAFSFVAENSRMDVSLDWADVIDQYGVRYFAKVNVVGSRNHEVYSSISNAHEEILKQPEYRECARVLEQLQQLQQTDPAAYEKLKMESEELMNRFRSAVLKRQLQMIRENRDVEAVGSNLGTLVSLMSLEELEELFNSLVPHVQESSMAAGVREELENMKRVRPGMSAPEIVASDINGESFRLSDLRGKYVILDFWASWCKPCRAANPHLIELWNKYHAKGLEIVCVASDDGNFDKWREAIDKDGIGMFHHLLRGLKRTDKGYDHSNDLSGVYNVHVLPTKYLIGPDGKIIGQMSTEEITEKLAEVLSSSPSIPCRNDQ